MDIGSIILAAKLDRYRKDAQVDTCAVFAAALYDVLSTNGVDCQMVTAVEQGIFAWSHAVVEVAGHYYDSMGEFSASIFHARAKLHPTITLDICYRPDSRSECYEPEDDKLHAFYVKMLNKAILGQTVALAA